MASAFVTRGPVGGSGRHRAVEGNDELIFRIKGKDFHGESAVEVVRALERDDSEYAHRGGTIRQYLIWAIDHLGGTISERELAISDRLDDETLALGYLLLLDEYGVGEMVSQDLA